LQFGHAARAGNDMIDSNEIEALKASVRGAVAAAAAVAALQPGIDALDSRGEIRADVLDELARVTLAHAVAAQALRGLVENIRRRRTA
jgi:hypothetical protein